MADLEQQLEEAIARHRTELGATASTGTNGVSRPTTAVDPEHTCPECSASVVDSANFCANCGAALTTPHAVINLT